MRQALNESEFRLRHRVQCLTRFSLGAAAERPHLHWFSRILLMPFFEAGLPQHVCSDSGDWLFVDVGFASKGKSCGLAVGTDEPVSLTFADMNARINDNARETTNVPLNLLLEAPLSVAFSPKGNPTGRCCEIGEAQKGKRVPRYWYLGLGCAVMTSALYLLRELHDSASRRTIRLFEGFASFKERGTSSHCDDVTALCDVVFNSARSPDLVLDRDQLLAADSGNLVSAFAVAGMDLGVPCVVPTPASLSAIRPRSLSLASLKKDSLEKIRRPRNRQG